MSRLYSDNALAFFGSSLNSSDLTFTCATGKGALFPSPSGVDFFIATFESADKTKIEKVKVTSRSGDSFTIIAGGRGQEGTTPQSWTTNDLISIRWTSSSNSELVKAVQLSSNSYSNDTGTSTNFILTLDPVITSYALGLRVLFKAANTCSSPVTVNINSLGTKSIKKFVSMDLSPEDIIANQLVEIMYDGTNFQLISPVQTVRPGVLSPCATPTAPLGNLLCNGVAVSRTLYANLFSAIGTLYGAGDGSTTFNLPNCNGRVLVGAGTGSGLTNRVLAAIGGEENHVLTVAELAPHTHSELACGSHLVGPNIYGSVAVGNVGATTGSTGSGSGHNTMQPFLVSNFIIKV